MTFPKNGMNPSRQYENHFEQKWRASIKFDADELDTFKDCCYKPYHQESTEYFQNIFDAIEEKIEKVKNNENSKS